MRIKINTRFWAWACLFSVIPSVIWRVAMIAGVDTGFAEAALYRTRTGMSYVLGLETLQLGGAGRARAGALKDGQAWHRAGR